MTKIISVNAGSSSLKFQLFEMPQETVLTSGVIERIGLDEGIFTIKVNGEKKTVKQPIPDHTVAVKLLLDALVEYKIVDHLDEIKGAGHRAVHGGEIFTDSVKVDDDVVAKFESLSDLAPLHNPAGLIGYRAFKEALPDCVHTFVFDTAFHSTMAPETYMYALPYEYYEKYQIRRYGFHGTSHKYVSMRCAQLMERDIKDMKIITLPSGQRRQHHGSGRRQVRQHLYGLHAAGRRHDGHALRRHRSGDRDLLAEEGGTERRGSRGHHEQAKRHARRQRRIQRRP